MGPKRCRKKILFGDKVHFCLNGHVNKPNYRIRSDNNPKAVIETPLHLQKVSRFAVLYWQREPMFHTFFSVIRLQSKENTIEQRFMIFSCLNCRILMWTIFACNRTVLQAIQPYKINKIIEEYFSEHCLVAKVVGLWRGL